MRTDVWARSVRRYILPHLPGDWKVSGSLLYREPTQWLLCYLGLRNSRFSSSFYVSRGVQLLAVPNEYLVGPYGATLGHGTGQGLWKAPTTVRDAEIPMHEILELIRAEGLRFFDTVGTLPGFTAAAQERALAQPRDIHLQETIFYLRLIHGDVDAALAAAQAVERSDEDRPWAEEIRIRVAHTAAVAARSLDEAREILKTNVTLTKTNIGLPS